MSEVATAQPELSPTLIHNAIRNEHGKSFQIGDREFPLKDLGYDDYLEFVDLARPIVEIIYGALELDGQSGDAGVSFNPASIDMKSLIKISSHELPRMAWICCKQSDPNIKIADVKRLAGRPFALLEVVLMQIQHNQLIKEFSDFFPRVGKIIGALVGEVASQTTPDTTRS